MKMILQIGVVLGICLLGEGISLLLPIPFPGSVIAIVLLFLLLWTLPVLLLADWAGRY